ncbi:MAG: NAD(P)H-binding protein [Leadbetterella sp.]|nr:NAD(P)H-binding protein [Leadbetterella sp.]
MKALILGSTGLVGSHVLQKTLADDAFQEVTVWVRRNPGFTHPKLKVVVTGFQDLPDAEADVVFSCLGTTRKKTPDHNLYHFIEVTLPVSTAGLLQKKGLQQFHYISSIGTTRNSRGAYLKNKWAAESGLEALGIPSLYLYRPSLIFGERKETRFLEDISNSLFSLIHPFLSKKYRRIAAETIAEAMIRNAKSALPGTHILESDRIREAGS